MDMGKDGLKERQGVGAAMVEEVEKDGKEGDVGWACLLYLNLLPPVKGLPSWTQADGRLPGLLAIYKQQLALLKGQIHISI